MRNKGKDQISELLKPVQFFFIPYISFYIFNSEHIMLSKILSFLLTNQNFAKCLIVTSWENEGWAKKNCQHFIYFWPKIKIFQLQKKVFEGRNKQWISICLPRYFRIYIIYQFHRNDIDNVIDKVKRIESWLMTYLMQNIK